MLLFQPAFNGGCRPIATASPIATWFTTKVRVQEGWLAHCRHTPRVRTGKRQMRLKLNEQPNAGLRVWFPAKL